MARKKDVSWSVADHPEMDGAILCVLMDIRDELKNINRTLNCPNIALGFRAMESSRKKINTIDRRLAKKIRLP